MKDLKLTLIATSFHVLELAVCLVAAVVITRFFKLGTDETGVVIGVVVNSLAKFARTSDMIPISDYTRK